MKSKRILFSITGILVFFSIILVFVWLKSPARRQEPKERSIAEVVNLIEKKQVKEAAFKGSQVEFTDVNNDKHYTNLGSEPVREQLLSKINEFNTKNTGTSIKFSEEPVSSGYFWIMLINTLPFYLMWGITLAVIVYAVTVLSRNKG